MKYFGLTEELPWPHEEVDDNSIAQVYENTPWSSLNVSISGEDVDEIGYSEGQTTLGETWSGQTQTSPSTIQRASGRWSSQGVSSSMTRIRPKGFNSVCSMETYSS